MGTVIKVFMVAIGLAIFVMNLFSLARRKMAPMFSVVWTIFALLMIVLGIALKLSVLSEFISWPVAFLLLFSATCVVFSIYLISTQLSELIAQNHELTMQVSLLNEENATLRRKSRADQAAKEQKDG